MTELSINQKKFIRSLHRKKIRNETGLFLVEGDKMVRELLHTPSGENAAGEIHFGIRTLVATVEWLEEFGAGLPGGIEILSAKAEDLRQIASQQEPNKAIAIAEKADYQLDIPRLKKQLVLGLENIQDPGNLGAIIRIADWFGIRDVLCSGECVELYNPKVIQSTMGSFLRVRVHYLDIAGLLSQIRGGKSPNTEDIRDEVRGTGKSAAWNSYPVLGTGSQGDNLYESILPTRGMILLGNESRGLSESLMRLSDSILSIPRHDPGMHPESLNVASAAAVICAEFRRQAHI